MGMSFTIAIVGRPNVGKSTLFNRLVGRRVALVDDRPGVTRDRREGEAPLGGLDFTLIDTAGVRGGRRPPAACPTMEPAEEVPDAVRPIRVAVVGRPNAGKSTLVNRLLGEDRMLTGPEAGITRDTIEVDLRWKEREFHLHDTAGLRRPPRIHEKLEKL